MTTAEARWSSAGRAVDLNTNQWRVRVNLDQLRSGLQGMTGQPQDIVLGIDLPGQSDGVAPATLIDHHVRQPDLVAVYERSGPENYRAQIDWRFVAEALPTTTLGGIHLWLSLQTDQLDSQPSFRVISELNSEDLLCGGIGAGGQVYWSRCHAGELRGTTALLCRLPARRQSLLLCAVPQDVSHCALTHIAGHWRCEYRVLGEHLEKGVIRRARLAAYLMPSEDDESVAGQLLARFLESPLPLTV